MIVQTKWDLGDIVLSPINGERVLIEGINANNLDGRYVISYLLNEHWETETELIEVNDGK